MRQLFACCVFCCVLIIASIFINRWRATIQTNTRTCAIFRKYSQHAQRSVFLRVSEYERAPFIVTSCCFAGAAVALSSRDRDHGDLISISHIHVSLDADAHARPTLNTSPENCCRLSEIGQTMCSTSRHVASACVCPTSAI